MKAKKIRKLQNQREKSFNQMRSQKERFLKGKVKYGLANCDWDNPEDIEVSDWSSFLRW
jgi:hypothetical protein